ncbi:MAG: hypothetical protein OEY18_05895 [Candidatus Aminicenantes bacterium]|nr:hypothetical protein [Candidatus Aminicenantes bacterium]MDH5384223.1 hypothetical protein [Candidatus Aminicenantes bacterium]MDH5745272.1 hypothetical protein [Candidatus Aminicenantes bacterium]
MTNKKEKDSKMDDLLKQVFQDDLPPEIERRMKNQFIQFKENIERADQESDRTSRIIWQRFFKPISWDWLRWVIRKEVMAFSSMIMIIVGGFLHVSGHHNAMAKTLSFLNTSVSISNQVQEAKSMECKMQVTAEDGLHLTYTIRWFSPEMTRADVYEGEIAIKSLWVAGPEIVVADYINTTYHKYQSLEQIEDHEFMAVMGFLSPERLAAAIYKEWEPRQYRKNDQIQKGTYVYLNDGGKVALEMTVDMNTNLPVRIKKFAFDPTRTADAYELTMEAQFSWDKLNSPQHLIPQSQRDNLGAKDILKIRS